MFGGVLGICLVIVKLKLYLYVLVFSFITRKDMAKKAISGESLIWVSSYKKSRNEMETYLHYFMQYFIGFHQISLNQTSLTQKVKTELFVLRTDSQLNIMNSEENCISILFFPRNCTW